MKLLLYDMGAFTQNDIMYELDKMGIAYENVLYKLKDIQNDSYFEKCIKEILADGSFDAVFSVNFFPVLAQICNDVSIKYIAWSYDSPLCEKNLEETMGLPGNYVFLFDKEECKKWNRKGCKNVFHMPLAVNVERLNAINITNEDKNRFGCDVSMVGQLYESVLPDLLQFCDPYDSGYISALIEAQLKLYGCYLFDEVVSDELTERMNAAYRRIPNNPLHLGTDVLRVHMAKEVTNLERSILLEEMAAGCKVHLYSSNKGELSDNVHWKGSAGYFDEMPKIFKLSKINLNISLKCIQSGIPLRALDILASGGFLLSNYQSELAEYFTDGEDVVMYYSMEDALAKCEYYLKHEEERLTIAHNGQEKVKALFGYEGRLKDMFAIAELLS